MNRHRSRSRHDHRFAVAPELMHLRIECGRFDEVPAFRIGRLDYLQEFDGHGCPFLERGATGRSQPPRRDPNLAHEDRDVLGLDDLIAPRQADLDMHLTILLVQGDLEREA